jgi:hypothetical protein
MSNKLFYPICLALILALAGFAQAELLPNPGFEAGLESWKTWGGGSGSGAGGWFYNSDTHATVREDGTAHGGDKYVEVGIADMAGSWWAVMLVFQEHPVTEGQTYQISAWFRDGDADGATSLITGGGMLQWEWRDAAPGENSDTDDRGGLIQRVSHNFDLTGEWTHVVAAEVAPPGAKGVTVIFGSTWGGINLDVDDTSFVQLGGKASGPDPADGEFIEQAWATLTWKPGNLAVSHNVYMGDNFDDVNDGAGDTFRGNQAATFYSAGIPEYAYPDGLVPGTTYYWRIDEVNDAEPNSPWKGDVWSFSIASKKAYLPVPSDGDKYIDVENTVLSWTPGFGAVLHTVYFGDDFDTVATATDGPQQGLTSFSPGPLELGKTYFWRVDELGTEGMQTGDVWSFKTMPYVTITDPNLVGWWKLDEGSGVNVLDDSGHGNHGTLMGDAQWVVGHDGEALEFTGAGTYVDCGNAEVLNLGVFSVSFWCNIPSTQAWNHMISKGQHVASGSPGSVNWGVMMYESQETILFETYNDTGWVGISADTTIGQWHHVVATYDGDTMQLYHDGELAASTTGAGILLDQSRPLLIGARSDAGSAGGYFSGSIDDVRIYNKVLNQDEVMKAMQGDPTLAWEPSPANKSTPDIYNATSLSWSPGAKADQHDVYFGTDKDAVDDADTTTADIYRGRQAATSYSLPEGAEWGGGPYYWRIDEYNTDGTISKGNVWSFIVADFILVDDFEDYDAGANQIWYAWHDGLGYGTPGTESYFAGNGTGAAVGDENTASYMEETIVNSGSKSMPLYFDNNKQGYSMYSETELTITAPRDWTEEGVANLSLWFKGYPASAGNFVEGPVGTYTMTASGTDITGSADEFHFAYKMLTGAGSIVAKVQSIDNTNAWAKAGVMIRETPDPDSAHAMTFVTPGNGVVFEYRPATGGANVGAAGQQTGITAPYWVKIDRAISGSFTASSSTNGTTWVTLGAPQTIAMGANVYIGLALTSTDAALTCQSVFSNVTTTGNVTGQWAHQDIGISSNDAEPLYVAVSNSTGASAVVVNEDANAAQIDTWTEWVIPLQAFVDQGIVLTNVDRIAIGLGTRGNISTPGGSGKMYFDDIRLNQPAQEPQP